MAVPIDRDLRAWQAAMEPAGAIYHLTTRSPERELYGPISPMRRAAVRVPTNIARGNTSGSTGECLYRSSCARGHPAEPQTQIDLAGRLKYLKPEETEQAPDQTVASARQIHASREAPMRDG